MTFCLGVKVSQGLLAIADTRITSGTECITARKISVYEHDSHSFFLMTSGLRSVRDKTITYFEDALEDSNVQFDRLYKAVNAFARELRRVAEDDGPALEAGNLRFDLHALVGGRLRHDREPMLYLVYPQGNWVEISPGTPYCIIGESGYGKPILDRTLKFQDSIPFALKVGCLAFDSTRISAANVDFPIDVAVYDSGSQQIIEHRYEKQDLIEISNWWQERLRQSVSELPSAWQSALLAERFSASAPRHTIPLGS